MSVYFDEWEDGSLFSKGSKVPEDWLEYVYEDAEELFMKMSGNGKSGTVIGSTVTAGAHQKPGGKTSPGYTPKGNVSKVVKYAPCYEKHPPLPIKVKGETFFVYGGNCGTPIVKDADVYVGLDHSFNGGKQALPWTEGYAFPFLIADMSVPNDLEEFIKMINWVGQKVLAGSKVHVGCIGGHGRTGLVLSVLVNHLTGMKDSTTYVRENYCESAVESETQVKWLKDNFGITPVKCSKFEAAGFNYYNSNAVVGGDAHCPSQDNSLGIWGYPE